MSELVMDGIKENLESLKMGPPLGILNNYLKQAAKDKLNLVYALPHLRYIKISLQKTPYFARFI